MEHAFLIVICSHHKWPNLTVALNRSRSTQTPHLNKLQWAIVLNATFIDSRPLFLWFQRKKWRLFTIYGHGGHRDLRHVTGTSWTTFQFFQPLKASYEIWLQFAQQFLMNINIDIWVTLAEGQGVILTFNTQVASSTHQLHLLSWLQIQN